MLVVDVLPGVSVTAIDGITITAKSRRKSAQGNTFRFPEYRVMIISDHTTFGNPIKQIKVLKRSEWEE